MHLPGLTAARGRGADADDARGVDVTLRLCGGGPGGARCARRRGARALQLACGVALWGAMPWLSIESVNDRRAARVATLRPCYRDTLVGLVCPSSTSRSRRSAARRRAGSLRRGRRDRFSRRVRAAGRRRRRRRRRARVRARLGPNGRESGAAAGGAARLRRSATCARRLRLVSHLGGDVRVGRGARLAPALGAGLDGDATGCTQGRLGAVVATTAEAAAAPRGGERAGGRSASSVRAHADWTVAIHADQAAGGAPPSPGSRPSRPRARRSARAAAARARAAAARAADWAPPDDAGGARQAYLLELFRLITALASVLETARADAPQLLPLGALQCDGFEPRPPPPPHQAAAPAPGRAGWARRRPRAGCRSSPRSTSSQAPSSSAAASASAPSPPARCASRPPASCRRPTTPRAVGGRGGGGRARRPRPAPGSAAPPPRVVVRFVPASASRRAAPAARARVAPERALAEVAALGLWSNFANAHPHARAPVARARRRRGPPAARALAARLREVLPDGPAGARARPARRGRSPADALGELGLGNAQSGDDEKPVKEDVTLLNGDRFDGHWLFGRKHGKGVYTFTSGSKYEGTWHGDKMVGIGFFTGPDGKRNVIRHPAAPKA